MEFTKSERKQMRELAGAVYEAEAHARLEGLDSAFARWRTGECLSSELLAKVHEFHQHQARELWSSYQGFLIPWRSNAAWPWGSSPRAAFPRQSWPNSVLGHVLELQTLAPTRVPSQAFPSPTERLPSSWRVPPGAIRANSRNAPAVN